MKTAMDRVFHDAILRRDFESFLRHCLAGVRGLELGNVRRECAR
jgi:hypothetical protein